MELLMYDSNNNTPLRYIFSNRDGGPISLPYGTYCGLAMNCDNTDWAMTRSTDNIDSFEVYTPDADELSAYGLTARSVPRAEGAEEERIATTPGMLWTDREDNITLPVTTKRRTITLYPCEAICHYTVEILDVENLKYLHGTEIDGTISGMAEGFFDGKELATDNKVTMPFVLNMNADENRLQASFLTFGECPHVKATHTLSVYLILTDGSKWHYTFDVTDQVTDAPDPTHVNIVVKGLTLPHPIASSGGFIPDVNDWQSEHIDLKM